MFKKGQKVWCLIYGQGVVTEVDNSRFGNSYPVLVEFQDDDSFIISYTSDGKFHNLGNITLFPYPVEVVKAITKPSINWSHVKGEYKWLSVDKDGSAYVYEDEPERSESDYWFSLKGSLTEVNGLASYTPGTCDWKDSLIKRPESDNRDN